MRKSRLSAGMRKVFEIEDGRGRPVCLYNAQWKHICDHHPEMSDAMDAIKLTISDPDTVARSDTLPRDPDGERRVNSRLGTHQRYRAFYVRVPIEYSDRGNWVVTSHVALLPPDGELIYVRVASR